MSSKQRKCDTIAKDCGNDPNASSSYEDSRKFFQEDSILMLRPSETVTESESGSCTTKQPNEDEQSFFEPDYFHTGEFTKDVHDGQTTSVPPQEAADLVADPHPLIDSYLELAPTPSSKTMSRLTRAPGLIQNMKQLL